MKQYKEVVVFWVLKTKLPSQQKGCWVRFPSHQQLWLFCEIMGQLCLVDLRSVCGEQEEKQELVRACWHTRRASPIKQLHTVSGTAKMNFSLFSFFFLTNNAPGCSDSGCWHMFSPTQALPGAKRVRGARAEQGTRRLLMSWCAHAEELGAAHLPFPAQRAA